MQWMTLFQEEPKTVAVNAKYSLSMVLWTTLSQLLITMVVLYLRQQLHHKDVNLTLRT